MPTPDPLDRIRTDPELIDLTSRPGAAGGRRPLRHTHRRLVVALAKIQEVPVRPSTSDDHPGGNPDDGPVRHHHGPG